MRTIQLTTRYSSDRRGQRFVIVDGFPGLGAELYPTELRALARQLHEMANDADQGASGNRQYPTKDSNAASVAISELCSLLQQ